MDRRAIETGSRNRVEVIHNAHAGNSGDCETTTDTGASELARRQAALKIWKKLFDDDVFGRAAQLAYYWLFSIFPLLIFLTTLLAFLPMRQNLDQWIGAFGAVLLPEAYTLLNNTFQQIASQQCGELLSFSILLMLLSSSPGLGAISAALYMFFW